MKTVVSAIQTCDQKLSKCYYILEENGKTTRKKMTEAKLTNLERKICILFYCWLGEEKWTSRFSSCSEDKRSSTVLQRTLIIPVSFVLQPVVTLSENILKILLFGDGALQFVWEFISFNIHLDQADGPVFYPCIQAYDVQVLVVQLLILSFKSQSQLCIKLWKYFSGCRWRVTTVTQLCDLHKNSYY